MYYVGLVTKTVALTLILTACNAPDLKKLVQTPTEYLTIPSPFKNASVDQEKVSNVNGVKALEQIIESQTPKVSLSGGFAKGIVAAVESDPMISGQKKLLLSKLAEVDFSQA